MTIAPTDPYAGCTEECERMPECIVCGKRKSPLGRSVPLEAATGYCDHWDCPGYE